MKHGAYENNGPMKQEIKIPKGPVSEAIVKFVAKRKIEDNWGKCTVGPMVGGADQPSLFGSSWLHERREDWDEYQLVIC